MQEQNGGGKTKQVPKKVNMTVQGVTKVKKPTSTKPQKQTDDKLNFLALPNCDQLEQVCRLDVRHDFSDLRNNEFYILYGDLHPVNLNVIGGVEDFLINNVYMLQNAPMPLDMVMHNAEALRNNQSFAVSVPNLYDERLKAWLGALVYSATNQIEFMTDTTLLSREAVCEMNVDHNGHSHVGHFAFNSATRFDRGMDQQEDGTCNKKRESSIAIFKGKKPVRLERDEAPLVATMEHTCLLSYLDCMYVIGDELLYNIPEYGECHMNITEYIRKINDTYALAGKKLPSYIRVIDSLVQRDGGRVEPSLVDLLAILHERYNVTRDLLGKILIEAEQIDVKRVELRIEAMKLVKILFDIKGAGDRLQLVACPSNAVFATNDRISVVLGHLMKRRVIRTATVEKPAKMKVLNFYNLGSGDIAGHLQQALLSRLKPTEAFLRTFKERRDVLLENVAAIPNLMANKWKLDQLQNVVNHIANINIYANGFYGGICHFEVQRLFMGLIIDVIDKFISVLARIHELDVDRAIEQLVVWQQGGDVTEEAVHAFKQHVQMEYYPEFLPANMYTLDVIRTVHGLLDQLRVPVYKFGRYINEVDTIQKDLTEFDNLMKDFNVHVLPLVNTLPWIANLYEASSHTTYKLPRKAFEFKKWQEGVGGMKQNATVMYFPSKSSSLAYKTLKENVLDTLEEMQVQALFAKPYNIVLARLDGGVPLINTMRTSVRGDKQLASIKPSVMMIKPTARTGMSPVYENELVKRMSSMAIVPPSRMTAKRADLGDPTTKNVVPFKRRSTNKALQVCYEKLIDHHRDIAERRQELEGKIPKLVASRFTEKYPDADPLIEIILVFLAKMERKQFAARYFDMISS